MTDMHRDMIFISHRTMDSDCADMILDFLVGTGIPKDRIFCSSLPGNDVRERISPEVRENLIRASLFILILSRDYNESAYCLNEAGVAWYLAEDVTVIPVALPEITPDGMPGFLNCDYKLRRLSDDEDVSYLFDEAERLAGGKSVSHTVITREIRKLKERYKSYLSGRGEVRTASSERLKELEAENLQLKERLAGPEDDEDIYEDGYHELKDGDGHITEKGEYRDGKLVDGIKFNVLLRIVKGDEEHEEAVTPDELKCRKWSYIEIYENVISFVLFHMDTGNIKDLAFYYVVDKKVSVEGRRVKPTFTNFRTLESFLEKVYPDDLEYLKTGILKYSETDYADVDV